MGARRRSNPRAAERTFHKIRSTIESLYTLSYPNFEVENAFLRHLLSTFSGAENGVLGRMLCSVPTLRFDEREVRA